MIELYGLLYTYQIDLDIRHEFGDGALKVFLFKMCNFENKNYYIFKNFYKNH